MKACTIYEGLARIVALLAVSALGYAVFVWFVPVRLTDFGEETLGTRHVFVPAIGGVLTLLAAWCLASKAKRLKREDATKS
jgi:hypothetical protein